MVGLDCLDGTPLIDIKPYFASTDSVPDAVVGWHKRDKARRHEHAYAGSPATIFANSFLSLSGFYAMRLREPLNLLGYLPRPRRGGTDEGAMSKSLSVALAALIAAAALSCGAAQRRTAVRLPHRRPPRSGRTARRSSLTPADESEDDAQLDPRLQRQIVDYAGTRGARHRHHRYAAHFPLLRARQRQGDPLRHRRRPRRLHLVGRQDRSSARPNGRIGIRRLK